MDADREAFVQTVERTWTALVGRGFFLSGKDTVLVERWFAADLPLDLVCEGLRAALEERRSVAGAKGLPSSLAYYRHGVEAAVQRTRELSPGALTDPEPSVYAGSPGVPEVATGSSGLAPSCQELDDAPDPVEACFAALEPEEQARIEAEVAERLLREPSMGLHGRALRRRAFLRDALERHHGLRPEREDA